MTTRCSRDRLACPERVGFPCAVPSCDRASGVTDSGIRFARCADHTSALLTGAFGPSDPPIRAGAAGAHQGRPGADQVAERPLTAGPAG